jgi:RluA family pseudouridine synthase
MSRKFRTSNPDAGAPLGEWLARRLAVTLEDALARVGGGGVFVDGRRARDPEQRLAARQTIVVHEERAPRGGWRVAYQDDQVLVVDKPAGLPSQATRGAAGALDEQVAARFPGARLLHRLDREASGLVLFTLPAGRARLQALLASGGLAREYLARVAGAVTWEEKTIDRPLGPDPKHRQRRAVVASGGQRAVTHAAVEGRDEGTTLLRLRLDTGRSHQIRVHLAAEGHPIVGDALYGGPPAARLMLHATRLAWEDRVIDSPWPSGIPGR